MLAEAFDGFHGVYNALAEGVAHGPENDIGIGAESLNDSTISATSTADEADFNFIGNILRFCDVGNAGCDGGSGA